MVNLKGGRSFITRQLISSLPFLLFSGVFKKYSRNSVSLMKINAAKRYIVGVKKVRQATIWLALFVVAFFFFSFGLFLIHLSILYYMPVSAEVRFYTSLGLGVLEFGAALSLFMYLFSEKVWMQFSQADDILKFALKEKM